MFRKLTTAYTKFIAQTRNKILGEIIVLGVGHRQTALKTASQTDADWFYNQYRRNILYVQFLFT